MIDLSEFKPYPVDPRYLVSRDGRIYSTIQNKIIGFRINRKGYEQSYIKHAKGQATLVHRIVAQTYIGSPPIGKYAINHIDGNKKNNNLKNLEYCSNKENSFHAMESGLLTHRKYNKEDIENIFIDYNNGMKTIEIAEKIASTASEVGKILKGKIYSNFVNSPYKKLDNRKHFSEGMKLKIKNLRDGGVTVKEIARILNIHRTSVTNHTIGKQI
jgi:predicted transcriptional regulator